MYHDEQDFLRALVGAGRQGVELEWLHTFLQDYAYSQNIHKSIQHANREWDI